LPVNDDTTNYNHNRNGKLKNDKCSSQSF
jgi:hypothetical protein